MNTIDLKYQIEIMYDLALQARADMYIEHPVRLVQSVKSIIGINPESGRDLLRAMAWPPASRSQLRERWQPDARRSHTNLRSDTYAKD